MKEQVILVTPEDRQIGLADKIKVHQKKLLHRAFSIFVCNEKNELLLQKRVNNKYHSWNLWANTCCSHQRPKETLEKAAHRRLKEEMGFNCELKEAFSFTYTAELENGLSEHEYDHVFLGRYNNSPSPNPAEVSEWKWVSLSELKKDLKNNPQKYASWLKIILKKHSKSLVF